MTSGSVARVLYDVQDGSEPQEASNVTEAVSHTVRSPGRLSLQVTTTDTDGNEQSEALAVKVSV